MKILIYMPTVSRDWGGVFQYTLGVLEAFSRDNENSYFLFNEGEDKLIQKLVLNSKNLILVKPKEVFTPKLGKRIVRVVNKISRRISPKINFEVIDELDQFLIDNKIEVAYCPFQASPPVSKVKKICTMHDVQELHFPEFFTSSERMKRAINYKNAIDNSDAIIVSFEHVKNDIVKYFQKPAETIFTCLFDLNNLWFSDFNENDLKNINELSFYDAFLLYPAATWEHKNHVNLLKALAEANKKSEKRVKLICTGNKTPFYYSVLEPLLRELNMEEDVEFLGIVDEKSLFTLYQRAHAVVIPTLYEAGSFPLFESIIMNIPVICSNVTSLPETVNNESFVFNPKDINELADKIHKVCFDKEFRRKNIENNKKRKTVLVNNNFLNCITRVFSN